MTATVKSIRHAILAGLDVALVTAPTPGPLVNVLPYSGQIKANGHVDTDAWGTSPTAFVALERERFGSTEGGAPTLLNPASNIAGQSTWQVLCIVTQQCAKTEAEAVDLLDDCAEAVVQALDGLRVEGLIDGVLGVVDHYPLQSAEGIFLHTVRIKATRFIQGRTDQEPDAVDLLQIDGDINNAGTPEDLNPVMQTRNDFTP